MKLIKIAAIEMKNSVCNYYVWFVLGIIINGFILSVYLTRMGVHYNGFTISYADNFILASSPRYFVVIVIPLFLLLIGTVCKHTFMVNQVTKYQKFENYWIKQVVLLTLYVVFLSAFLLLTVLLVGKGKSDGIINFDQVHSLFSFYNAGNTIQNPPLGVVVLSYFLFCVFTLELIGLLYLLLNWVIKQPVLCFLTIYLLVFINSYGFNITMKVFRISIKYTNWYPNRTFHFGMGGILILAIGILGKYVARRKEIFK